MGCVAAPWWRRPGVRCKAHLRPGALMPKPCPISEPIARIVAAVIAARHAVEIKGARRVAARRARVTRSAEPSAHAPLSLRSMP